MLREPCRHTLSRFNFEIASRYVTLEESSGEKSRSNIHVHFSFILFFVSPVLHLLFAVCCSLSRSVQLCFSSSVCEHSSTKKKKEEKNKLHCKSANPSTTERAPQKFWGKFNFLLSSSSLSHHLLIILSRTIVRHWTGRVLFACPFPSVPWTSKRESPPLSGLL